MGGGGPGGRQVEQESKTEPWTGQQPYLRDIYARAGALSYRPMPYYPGQTVAPRSWETGRGEEMTRERATGGSPLMAGAEDYYGDVMRGEYMNGNPYLDQMYARAAGNVGEQFQRITMPQLEGRFARAGRTGGGAYEGAVRTAGGELADRLAQLGEDIYSKDYVRERGYMDVAAQAAPGMAAAGYMDADRMRELGAYKEAYSQREIDALIKRYEYSQTEPWQRMTRYGSLVGAPVMQQEAGPFSESLARNLAYRSVVPFGF